jgi:Flp pilus assembly protein TadD
MPSNLATGLVALAAAAVGVLCYMNSLDGVWVFDDAQAIVQNPDVCGTPGTPVTANQIEIMFGNDFWGMPISSTRSHKSYRPLTVLSFRVNCAFSGLAPLYYHVVNVALHGICCALFAVLCSRASSDTVAALVSSLVFAVHPIHTEAVSSVVGRADVLGGVFFLFGLLAYPCGSQTSSSAMMWFRIFVTVSLAVVALLCKELGLMVLPTCIVYDLLYSIGVKRLVYMLKGQVLVPGKVLKPVLQRVTVLVLASVALLFWRFNLNAGSAPSFSPGSNPASESPSVQTRALTWHYTTSVHLRLMLAPLSLCCDWSGGSIPLLNDLSDSRVLEIVTMYLCVVACAVYIWRLVPASEAKFKLMHGGAVKNDSDAPEKSSNMRSYAEAYTLALGMTVVPLLPATNVLVVVGFVVAERILYIPSMGVCFAIGLMFSSWFNETRVGRVFSPRKPASKIAFIFVFVVGAILTMKRNADWRTPEALFSTGIAVNPANAKLHWGLGEAFRSSRGVDAQEVPDNERLAKAAKSYQTAIGLQPQDISVHNGLGAVLESLGRHKEAETSYRAALADESISTNTQAMYNLAKFLQQQKRMQEAGGLYEKAEASIRATRDAYANRLVAEKGISRAQAEDQAIATTASLHPEWSSVLNNFGMLLEAGLGRMQGANRAAQTHRVEQMYRLATKTNTKDAKAVNNLGRFFQIRGQKNEAEAEYLKALVVEPLYHTALYNLGSLLQGAQRLDEAEVFLQRAATVKPEDASTLNNLGAVYMNLGYDKPEYLKKAEQVYRQALGFAPGYALAYASLGQAMHMNGRLQEAIVSYKTALGLSPDIQGVAGAMQQAQSQLSK